MKRFNLTGLCIPEKHYMVDLSKKVEQIVRDYIEQGSYFTINRARQFGKTTLLSSLQRNLSDRYLVIRLSFEGVDGSNFDNNTSFVNMFQKNVAKRLIQIQADQKLIDAWNEAPKKNLIVSDKAFDILGDKITGLCSHVGKGVVLLIDEVDQCSDNQVFLNFLGMLRNKYLDMQEQLDTSFQSVILAGVYDVKNLKLKLLPGAEKKYNSPWNIAADFRVDMSFSVDEIAQMLEEYSADTDTRMDAHRIAEKIYFYTSGYPFLVSWLCKWMDENIRGEWSVENVTDAEKELLKNDNTLFDDIIKNIENNHELRKAVTGILFDGLQIPFVRSDSIIHLGIMFGMFSEQDGMVVISNVVFETLLYNHIIAGKILEKYHSDIAPIRSKIPDKRPV